MSKAWRVITDAFVLSMLIQTAQKPGKSGEVALQVRQLQNWANKIVGFRDEWKKEERANKQSGRMAEHSRRCDRTKREMLMTGGHYWLAGPMREIRT